MLTYTEASKKYTAMLGATVDEIWRRMARDPWAPLVVWYIPTTEDSDGRLIVGPYEGERPEGAEPVHPSSVPVDVTRSQLENWLADKCRRLPIFPRC